jgi:hypothetical protein
MNALKNPSPSAWIEPANLESNGKYTKHYTTEDNYIYIYIYMYLFMRKYSQKYCTPLTSSNNFRTLYRSDSAYSSIHPHVGRQGMKGYKGRLAFVSLTYPMGLLFLLGSCGIWLDSSLQALRSSLWFLLLFIPLHLPPFLSNPVSPLVGQIKCELWKASTKLCLHCSNVYVAVTIVPVWMKAISWL